MERWCPTQQMLGVFLMTETQEEYKARRKAISARYYQCHREAIKLAMTLDISVPDARKLIKENENEKGIHD
jgi:hypothetical protein